MAKHQVQRLGDEYVVVDDKQAILHKFPSQGEAELQVIALAEKEKTEKEAAKDEKSGAGKAKDDDNGNDKPHVGAQARHR